MIKRFESFSKDIKDDLRDYFNNIVDSGAAIDVKYHEHTNCFAVLLDGNVDIFQLDPEMSFIYELYCKLRTDDPELDQDVMLDTPEMEIVKNNPFFKRIMKISNLLPMEVDIYASSKVFELTIYFKNL